MSAPAVAAFSLVVAMSVAWIVGRRSGTGWIDVIWTLAVGAATAIALALAQAPPARRALVAGLVAVWSLRLALHIALRTAHDPHDPRYAALMEEWGARAPLRLFLFLQAQAVAGFVLAVAAYLAATAAAPVGSLATILAAGAALAAIAGEAAADAQLAAFKRTAPKGSVCERGLWALSRHPNYFFEWLFWAAIAGLALAAPTPLAFISLAAPAMMYALLRYASGVPHLEAHMRRTRPHAFADYARRTPVFFPDLSMLFRRK